MAERSDRARRSILARREEACHADDTAVLQRLVEEVGQEGTGDELVFVFKMKSGEFFFPSSRDQSEMPAAGVPHL